MLKYFFKKSKQDRPIELWEKGYLFEYPQVFNYIYDILQVDISKSLEDLWVECSILNKEYNFYGETGKLRESRGLYEVDSLYYTANYNPCIIEIKNRPMNNVKISDYSDTLNYLTERTNLAEFIISCNDILYSETNIKPIIRMRNDIIVSLLELGLINNDSRNLTVLDLFNKYKKFLTER